MKQRVSIGCSIHHSIGPSLEGLVRDLRGVGDRGHVLGKTGLKF